MQQAKTGGQYGYIRKFQGEKTGKLKGGRILVNEESKDHGFGSEMVVNGCFEDFEGRMRLKRMWKLVPQ